MCGCAVRASWLAGLALVAAAAAAQQPVQHSAQRAMQQLEQQAAQQATQQPAQRSEQWLVQQPAQRSEQRLAQRAAQRPEQQLAQQAAPPGGRPEAPAARPADSEVGDRRPDGDRGGALDGFGGREIDLRADSVEYNEKTGHSVYRGNVEIISGDLYLAGDVVEVRYADGALARVIATAESADKSAIFRRNDARRGRLEATARKIEYLAAKQTVYLRGNAQFRDRDKRLSAENIAYNIERRLVTADRNERARVRLTIVPPPRTPRR